MRSTKIFIICVILRLVNAIFTRTYDNPDEYWQAQEIAHQMVFGYGYVTWEWQERIRSYAHPLVFAAIYRLIQLLGLEETNAFIVFPRLLQGLFSAIADYATCTLAIRIFGISIEPFILFMTLCSWYNFFMAGRTLSNCMEMVFSILALNYWPLPNCPDQNWRKNLRVGLGLASLACLMRPTNAIIWLFLGLHLLATRPLYRWKIAFEAAAIVATAVIINTLVDTHIYTGSWTNIFHEPVFAPLAFFRINVVASISLFYGVHPWHWYISQGLPVMTTTILPLVVYGFWRAQRMDNSTRTRVLPLLHLLLWVVCIYSLLSHKEFRFLFPIFPLLLIFAAFGLKSLPSKKWRRWIVICLVATQLPMAIYLSLWHQRGVVDAMIWLRQEARHSPISIRILMPCHSTPYQSILHSQSTPISFLTCDPPLSGQSTADYMDEADVFYADPVGFLNTIDTWPTHLVMFEPLQAQLKNTLDQYEICERFFNSHWHDDWRRQGDVLILCRNKETRQGHK
ncbi:Alg9-like mannosyltransferase family-domain-containing protein [Phycomyces nitens]|nr:Alg9-like mannosyltransferase family-domain-containing protein [Phycomyces nitens]